MNGPGFLSRALTVSGVLATVSLSAVAAQQTKVAFSVNPSVFAAGQSASVFLCVTSQAPTPPITVNPGDTFTFLFPASVGTVSALGGVVVNSAALLRSDFSTSFGASHAQIVVRYNGVSKTFAYGDSVCVEVHFNAATLGSGNITMSSRFSNSVNGTSPFVPVSIVDFATGPAGPTGPTGPEGPPGPTLSRRAALNQWWTTSPQYGIGLGTTDLGPGFPSQCASDGTDLWVTNLSGFVTRVRGSDGSLVDTWPAGSQGTVAVLIAMGKVFITGDPNALPSTPPSGSYGASGPIRPNITMLGFGLYMIDPTKSGSSSSMTLVFHFPNGVGAPLGIAFDGSKIWMTTDMGIFTVTPGAALPWSGSIVNPNIPGNGMLFDGNAIWVTSGRSLLKLNPDASVAQRVALPDSGGLPVFDGKNIWVPTGNSLTVVDDATGNLLATLTGNGLNAPVQAAFDGQRILVTNRSTDTVSLWRAADLTPLGSFSTGSGGAPFGVCSDGTDFFITLEGTGKLGRF